MNEKTNDVEKLIDAISWIGTIKDGLSLQYRGWVNELGLYVQLHSVSLGTNRIESLKAGGKLRPCLIAESRKSDGYEWKLKKFDRNRWERHFAHLVQPTLEIAAMLNHFNLGGFTEESWEAMLQAIQHFKETGEWHGFDE